MKHPSAHARRSLRIVGVSAAALALGSAGLGIGGITPAGAVTTALTPGSTAPWTSVAYQNGTDVGECDLGYASDLPADQTFVTGPATPPSGAGSLRFKIDLTGEQQLFRTAEYNDTALSDIEGLQYSTYVETADKQPPYFRLTLDNDGDGTYDEGAGDETLFFFPANQVTAGTGPAVATGQWQTWDLDAGTWSVNGDGATTTTLAAYALAHDGTTIVDSFAPSAGNPNEGGGMTIAQGCGGAGTSNSVTFVDEIVVDVAAQDVDKYDLEATAPARTLTVSPATGDKGSTVTVSGTDCFEPTALIGMGQSYGESGDDLVNKTVTPAADGTFSGTLTIPQNADPGAKQSVYAVCGTFENEAFRYTSQGFDVTGQENPTGANGYRMVAADGGIFTFGAREFHGSTGSLVLNKPIVGGATDKGTYNGYWIVASDGGVFTFNAPFYGSLGDQVLASPATEIEPTPTGKGYYIVLANGRVHTFGDANHFGDMSGKALNKPIIGMSVTPTGKGYWLVGEDGGIFNFGDAGFFGSTGNMKLNAPVIDLAPAVDNNGYYLLAKDGGVFTFGTADFKGSTGSMTLNAPVIAMLVNPTGSGYWLAATDGGIFSFGAGAEFLGSMGATKLNSPVLDLIN